VVLILGLLAVPASAATMILVAVEFAKFAPDPTVKKRRKRRRRR